MKKWEESQDEVRKVRPDKEMARSMSKMIDIRMQALDLKDNGKFASLVVEDYYEIIKEAATALMALDGYKTLSHEVLIGYLEESVPQLSEDEILLADQLRKLRNKIAYKGFFVPPDYLERNGKRIRKLVLKLVNVLEEKIQ